MTKALWAWARLGGWLVAYLILVYAVDWLQPSSGNWTSLIAAMALTFVNLWGLSNALIKEFLGLHGTLSFRTRQKFRAGRAIGPLERILAVICIAYGQPTGIGYLMAAKGFVRSKDLESRDFAEYFLLGTLSSIILAIPIGAVWAHHLQRLHPSPGSRAGSAVSANEADPAIALEYRCPADPVFLSCGNDAR